MIGEKWRCALHKFVWVAVVASFACNLTFAQDATKAEPKHYKLAFENDKVQVVYVQYGPHEKSSLHAHPQGVMVNITAAHLLFTGEHGKIHEAYSKPGEARWYPAIRHAVENLGDAPFSGVYIGVKGGMSASLHSRNEALHFDEQTAKLLAAYLAEATGSGAQPSAAPFAKQK